MGRGGDRSGALRESLPEAGAGLAEAVLDELGAGLSRDFGATVRRFVVEAAAPRISW
jgi:hypothetical protein